MQVGDLIRTVYSDRMAVITEVTPLPNWNKAIFGVKFRYIDQDPLNPEGMQPSDKIRLISTLCALPVHLERGSDGWWTGGLWGLK